MDQEIDVVRLIDRLRRLGRDTANVEVKAAAGGLPAGLSSTISAFSNTHGGTIILGLDESSGFTPAAGFDAIKTADALKELVRARHSGETQAALEPSPLVSIEIVEFEETHIVVGNVDELPPDLKPSFVTSKGKEAGSFERLLDGDHRMGTHAIFLLSSNRAQPVRDIDVVPGATVGDLDEVLLAGLIERVRRTRPRINRVATSQTELLEVLRVLDRPSGGVTLAGLLALGRYPQEFLPQLMISFASFPTTTKDLAAGQLRMLDRATFEGPIPIMIADAVRRLESALPTRRLSLGPSSRDVLEIPQDVLREAIVNALAHRDYSSFSESEQVRIELYPDRLEVSNPGGIWGGRTERELLDGTSRSRNSFLTRLLTDVPLEDKSTVSENQGTGLRYMVGTMKESGLPVPTFAATNTLFTTVLARHGLLDPFMAAHLAAVGAETLDERSRAVLALSLQRDRIDDQVVRYQLDMDSFDAWKLMQDLARAGWLVESRRGVFASGARLLNIPLMEFSSSTAGGSHPIERLLAERGEMTIHELVEAMGLSINSIRYELRRLIESGAIVATAPPSSRKRAYRLPGQR